jgi:hypothetical protein
MTDVEIYTLWATAYDTATTRRILGMISPDDCDRLVRDMEERLGVDKWSQARWRAAFDAYNAEKGA